MVFFIGRSAGPHKPLALVTLCFTCIFTVAWSASGLAAEVDEEAYSASAVANALAALDARKLDEHWFFTLTIDHEGEQRTVRSDPREPPALRRTLVSVEDRPATEEERRSFRAEEEERIAEENTGEQGFSRLVDIASLNLLGIDGDVAEYAFVPVIPKLEKASDSLRGKLLLDWQQGDIRSIDVFNVEKFSPAFPVSVEHFLLRFEFSQTAGHNLLALTESRTRGTLALVKAFDSTTRIEFGEYKALEQM